MVVETSEYFLVMRNSIEKERYEVLANVLISNGYTIKIKTRLSVGKRILSYNAHVIVTPKKVIVIKLNLITALASNDIYYAVLGHELGHVWCGHFHYPLPDGKILRYKQDVISTKREVEADYFGTLISPVGVLKVINKCKNKYCALEMAIRRAAIKRRFNQ